MSINNYLKKNSKCIITDLFDNTLRYSKDVHNKSRIKLDRLFYIFCKKGG